MNIERIGGKMLKSSAMLLIVALAFGSIFCAVQKAQLSASTKRLINDLESLPKEEGQFKLDDSLKKKYGIRETDTGPVVHAFIKVSEDLKSESLEKLNVKQQSVVGDIQTVVVPLENIKKLAAVEGVRHIEVSTPVKFR